MHIVRTYEFIMHGRPERRFKKKKDGTIVYLQSESDYNKMYAKYRTRKILIDDAYDRIRKLDKWNDYVLFEGIAYGIPHIFNDVHMENDCGGAMKSMRRKPTCKLCGRSYVHGSGVCIVYIKQPY